MLDGLLGRGGFSSKCKSLIKSTKTRIQVLRRRAEAKQRFLKEDLAKLLANGLDINAYGRTEEFLAGTCLLSCYDFIEKSCDYISNQLSIMQKQRECPEECREAVSSLMFAAARFSDLPELRDLRDVFQERYGNSLEYFVNKVFVEKLASRPTTMEKRFQILLDIALEFSIKWDSRGFQQRMANPPSFAQDQLKKHGPSRISNSKDIVHRIDKHDVTSNYRRELVNGGHTIINGRQVNGLKREELDIQYVGRKETNGNGHRSPSSKEAPILKVDNNDISFRGRREYSAEKHGSLSGKVDTTPKTVGSSSSSPGKMSEYVDMGPTLPKRERQNPLSVGKSRKEEEDGVEPYYNSALPPPYVKLKDNATRPPYVRPKASSYRAPIDGFDSAGSSMDPSPRNGVNAVRIQKESNHTHYEEQGCESARVSSHGREKDRHNQNDVPLPKPRSVRRKHSKSSASQDDAGNIGEAGIVKRTSNSRRKEHSRKGLQILFDDEYYQKDEEEKMMDKLLLHYSKKSSNYDVTKLRKKSSAHPSHHIEPDVAELVSPPTRSISLPHEQTAPSEATKVYARANSFQPDNQARHVHPKLPDYDDLAARFAALRGR